MSKQDQFDEKFYGGNWQEPREEDEEESSDDELPNGVEMFSLNDVSLGFDFSDHFKKYLRLKEF